MTAEKGRPCAGDIIARPVTLKRTGRFRAKSRQVSSAQTIRKPTTKTAIPARAATTYSDETRLGRRTRLHSSSAMGSSAKRS